MASFSTTNSSLRAFPQSSPLRSSIQLHEREGEITTAGEVRTDGSPNKINKAFGTSNASSSPTPLSIPPVTGFMNSSTFYSVATPSASSPGVSSSSSVTSSSSANQTTMPTEYDERLAELASQYYSISRNRSYSAPIPPSGTSTSAWQFSETTMTSQMPPRPISIIASSVDTHRRDATRAPIPPSPHVSLDLQSLQLNVEPENEPMDAISGEKSGYV